MIKENSYSFFRAVVFGIGFQSFAHAGQPITEDAETTAYVYVEYNPYIFETKIKAWHTFESPSLETNVGLLPNLQGHLITSVILYSPRKGSSHYWFGDNEAGIKYRFIQETETIPQIAFYPKVTLPVGDVKQGTGLGGVTESPALWFLKTIKAWKLSGGGGYTFSQAPNTFSYPFGGLLLQREITKSLTLGGEFYGQGASLSHYGSTSIFTFGGNYNFTKNFALLFSVGHSIAGAETLTSYVGLDWTWGPDEPSKESKSQESKVKSHSEPKDNSFKQPVHSK